jgi:hypothetical protein
MLNLVSRTSPILLPHSLRRASGRSVLTWGILEGEQQPLEDAESGESQDG